MRDAYAGVVLLGAINAIRKLIVGGDPVELSRRFQMMAELTGLH